MARGAEGATAMDMSKFMDTNYHMVVSTLVRVLLKQKTCGEVMGAQLLMRDDYAASVSTELRAISCFASLVSFIAFIWVSIQALSTHQLLPGSMHT